VLPREKNYSLWDENFCFTELRHEVFFATKSEPHLTKIVQHVLHLNAEKSNKKNSDKTKKHVWDHWSPYRYLET
jgi:hypothetical protein